MNTEILLNASKFKQQAYLLESLSNSLPTISSNVIILERMKNLILASLVAQSAQSPGVSLNVWGLVMQAGWVVKAVMLLLVIASIVCWTIILWKSAILRNAKSANQKFSDSFWAAGSLEGAQKASKSHLSAPMTRVFESGLHEYNQITGLKMDREEASHLLESNVTRSLDKAILNESTGLQKNLQFLATTASAGPFIGLFGTVWGIMTAFINIGQTGASNLAVVAPGIAEALIATALGLFAAIPAAIYYNFFSNSIRELKNGMVNFAADFLNMAKRSL